MGFASYVLRDRACDWWEEVGRDLGSMIVVAMPWEEFVTRCHEEFAPKIEEQ